jgi:ABC-2 type transport system permease protein
MRKLWVLAWKEVKLAFRDIGAIVTMLVTPLALTMALGAAFGTSGGGISEIPVLLLNQDAGAFSGFLVEMFESEQVGDLVALETVEDEADARARVEADEVAALVVIPSDFSERVFPMGAVVQRDLGLDLLTLDPDAELSQEQIIGIAQAFTTTQAAEGTPTVVEIYGSPDFIISTSVVKSIVTQGIEILNMQVQGTLGLTSRLMGSGGAMDTASLMPEGATEGTADLAAALPIEVEIVSGTGRQFSWLNYSATSMAVIFLMFAVTSGGRTLLAERQGGTLPRLLVSPTPAPAILVGKMGGIVLTGLLQVVILWGATTFLFGAYWGPPLAVALSILCLVLCASGIGALISAWARTAGQAGAIGTIVTLIGSALSGSFFPRQNLPQWVQTISLTTPNAWGIEIFSRLQMGRRLDDILPQIAGVLVVTLVYYVGALIGFQRQFD